MNTYKCNVGEDKSETAAITSSKEHSSKEIGLRIEDHRPERIQMRKLQDMANNSHQVRQLRAMQRIANQRIRSNQSVQLQGIAGAGFVRQQGSEKAKGNVGTTSESPQNQKLQGRGISKYIKNEKTGGVRAVRVVQRLLADAQAIAQEMGVEGLNDRETVELYLKSQPKPEAGEGIDRIRVSYNKGYMNPRDRIAYTDIWPEAELETDDEKMARTWVEGFLGEINIEGLAESNGLGEVANAIRGHNRFREKEGLDLLNKFIIYSLFGETILNQLFENFSKEYLTALGTELSKQLSVYSNATVSDEVFKDIPGDTTKDNLEAIGVEPFVAVFQEGLNNLKKSIAAEYHMEVIIEHYFLHDKGYRNASTPLTGELNEVYGKRITEAKSQDSQEQV
jgi:hypothetical protein